MLEETFGVLHKSLVQVIVEDIEDRVISGELEPGRRLTEQAMCGLLDVSRTPLREAFRILENRGFLENKARRGVFVARMTQKEADDIYMVRASLESLATSLAVQAANRNPQSKDLTQKLREIHQKMGKAVAEEDIETYIAYNSSFHEQLILACNNDLLIEILRGLDKRTMRYRRCILTNVAQIKKSYKDHEALIRSIEKGDASVAEDIRKSAILKRMVLVKELFKDGEEDLS